MASWPLSGVHPLIGVGDEPGDPRIRSNMDDRTVKMRRRVSDAPRVIPVQWALTGSQWDTLLAFGKTTIAGWSLPFDFEDPHTDATISLQFREVPRKRLRAGHATPGSRKYLVDAVLEVLPS